MSSLILRAEALLKKLRASGFYHVMTGSILVKILTMFSGMFVARILTKTDMAVLSYTDNIYSYLSLFSGFGVVNGILRYCTIAETDEKNYSYFRFGIKFGLSVQILLGIIVIILASFVKFPFEGVKQLLLLLMAFPVVGFMYEYLIVYLRAEMQFKKYSGITVFYTAIFVVSVICFSYLWAVPGVILSRYLSLFVAICVATYFVNKIIRNKDIESPSKCRLSKEEKKEFISYSIASVLTVAISSSMPLNETFLVNNLIKDTATTADYKVAMTIPQLLLFITNSIMVFAIPHFSKHEKDKAWLLKNSKNIQLALGSFFGFAVIMYLLLSKPILGLIFGQKYVSSYFISNLLFIAYAINAGFRMVAINILMALGYAKFNAKMSIASVIIQLILDYIFISLIGVNGAAFGIMFVYILSGFIYWWYLIKKIKEVGISNE